MHTSYQVEYIPSLDGSTGTYVINHGNGITKERCRTHSYMAACDILTALRVSENRTGNRRYSEMYQVAIEDTCDAKQYPSPTEG